MKDSYDIDEEINESEMEVLVDLNDGTSNTLTVEFRGGYYLLRTVMEMKYIRLILEFLVEEMYWDKLREIQ